jgi:hypothetical protein
MRLLFEETKLMKTLGLKMLTMYGAPRKVRLPVTWHFLGAYFGRGYTPSYFKRIIYPAVNLEYQVKVLNFEKTLKKISDRI